MLRRLAFLSAFLLFTLPGAFRAFAGAPKKTEKEEIVRPSFAESISATVERGGKTVITLRAKAAGRETKYLIRTEPAHGHLGELRVSETGTATIEYFNSSEGTNATDFFTYAVQNFGACVSARATVNVAVVESPPKIIAPSDMNFGLVAVGGTVRKTIVLRNAGGTPYTASPQLPSPWSLEEEGLFVLLPGQSRELTVLFTPDSERSHTGELFFKGPPAISVGLRGEGVTIFDVQPWCLSVEPRPVGSMERIADLLVTNKTDSALAVEIQVPERLEKIPMLALGPHEKKTVAVRADPRCPQGGRAEIRVSARGATSILEALVTPLPAHVICEQGETICLGRTPDSGPLQAMLEFRNDGGMDALMSLKTPPWLAANPDRFLLEPGKSKKIYLEANGLKAGLQKGTVDYFFGKASGRVFVSTESAPGTAPVSMASPTVEENVKPNKVVDWGLLKTDQLVVYRISGRPESIDVFFRDPSPAKRTYQVERMRLTSRSVLIKEEMLAGVKSSKFDPRELAEKRLALQAAFEKAKVNDQVVNLWLPVGGVSITEVGNNVSRMSFPPAKGSGIETLRITPFDPEGKESPIRTVIHVPIDRKHPPWSPAIVALGIAAAIPVLISVLLLALKSRRKAA